MKEEIIKQITNYLIQHSEVMTCSNCKFQMVAPYECAKCNKIVRSNFVAEEATRIKYEMRAQDIMEMVEKGMRVENIATHYLNEKDYG